MTTIRVEKGVPIPPIRRGPVAEAGSRRRYPWDEMEIGDSFAVRPKKGQTHRELAGALAALFSQRRRQYKELYTMRREGVGFRVWFTGWERGR